MFASWPRLVDQRFFIAKNPTAHNTFGVTLATWLDATVTAQGVAFPSVNLKIPCGTSTGKHWLYHEVDSNDEFGEWNERDNVVHNALTIQVNNCGCQRAWDNAEPCGSLIIPDELGNLTLGAVQCVRLAVSRACPSACCSSGQQTPPQRGERHERLHLVTKALPASDHQESWRSAKSRPTVRRYTLAAVRSQS